MTYRIIEIGRRYAKDGYAIYVVGSKDEMMELCLLALNDGKLDYHIGAPDAGADKALILCWEQDVEDKFKDFTCVNLLKLKG